MNAKAALTNAKVQELKAQGMSRWRLQGIWGSGDSEVDCPAILALTHQSSGCWPEEELAHNFDVGRPASSMAR